MPSWVRCRRAGWAGLALAAGLVTGCVSGTHTSFEVPLGRPAAPLRADASDADTLAAVAAVLVERFELPLPAAPPLRAHFYSSQDAFEQGLVSDGGMPDRAMARDQARFAVGVGTASGMFFRGDRLALVPRIERVGLFAHELTHVSQFELAGGRRGGDQWIREGFADWIKYRTLEVLGMRTYADSRRQVLRQVARAGPPEGLPALGVLVTNRQWVSARNELGGPATYGQAFLAVDWLVERTGRERVLDYFRRFARRDDRTGHFRDAFGLPPGLFAEEFRTRLPTLLAGAGV